MNVVFDLPARTPAFIEVGERFISADEATVVEWRAARPRSKTRRTLLRFADLLGIKPQVRLLPAFQAVFDRHGQRDYSIDEAKAVLVEWLSQPTVSLN